MIENTNNEALISGIELLNFRLEPWGLDFIQLEKGHFTAQLQQVEIEQHMVQKIAFNRQVWQRGSAPKDYLNIGVLIKNAGHISWNNQPIDLNTIEIFSHQDGFDIVSPAGFQAYTVSLHKDLVIKIIEEYQFNLTFEQLSSQHRVFFCNSEDIIKIKQMFDNILSNKSQLSEHFCQNQHLIELSNMILQQFDSSDVSAEHVTTQTRNKIISAPLNILVSTYIKQSTLMILALLHIQAYAH